MMHAGAGMALRQFLGQYLVTARPWQRALIAAGVVCGALLMIALGLAFGHFTLAAAGVLLLLITGNAFVAILRARRARARGTDESQLRVSSRCRGPVSPEDLGAVPWSALPRSSRGVALGGGRTSARSG
jgi:hypothetical protein